MVRFYVIQIKMKKIAIDDIPEKYREKVKEELKKETTN